MRMEVPGVAPENLEDRDGRPHADVSGKRELICAENGSFHRRERNGGEFRVDAAARGSRSHSSAEAAVKNGMLTVRIPKREEAKPRQITVKAA